MKTLRRLFGSRYKRIPQDDFIRRLSVSVIGEGMLHPGNVYLIDWAIQRMPSGGCMLEIGTYGGLSTNLICYLAKKHRQTHPFFTCDPWIYEGFYDERGTLREHVDGRPDLLRTDYMRYIRDSYILATKALSGDRLPYSIQSTSAAFFDRWERNEEVSDVFGRRVKLGGPISFAYIDGDHSIEVARNDFNSVAKRLLPGGLVLLDDSAKGLPYGSSAMMGVISAREDFEVVARNPNYLLRKKA
jgi:predicted O-methyltransferase YrrM